MSKDFGTQRPLGVGFGDDDRDIARDVPPQVWPIVEQTPAAPVAPVVPVAGGAVPGPQT